MFGKKITKTEDRKWLVKNIYFHTSTVFIIGFMCLITTGSSLFVTSSGNDISVVNMHIKDNAVQDISITIDSTYTAISDIKKSDSKLDGSAEQMETAEKIKMPTNINPKHLILDAIALDDAIETKKLIAKYYDSIDGDANIRPLIVAAEKCKPKVTKMLIESGANVNIVGERGRYPLEAAVVNIVHDNASRANLYANRRDAFQKGCADELNYTSPSPSIDVGSSAIDTADQKGFDEVKHLPSTSHIEDHSTTTESVTHYTTTEGIETTTNINPKKLKELVLQAIRKDDEIETKRLIIKYYGDINGDKAFRPLHAASELCNSQKVVSMLIQNGADVETGRPGWTPIHVATYNDCQEIVKILIDNGADINAKTPYGYSALNIANTNDRYEIAELLSQSLTQSHPTANEYSSTPTYNLCDHFACGVEKSSAGSGEEWQEKSRELWESSEDWIDL